MFVRWLYCRCILAGCRAVNSRQYGDGRGDASFMVVDYIVQQVVFPGLYLNPDMVSGTEILLRASFRMRHS